MQQSYPSFAASVSNLGFQDLVSVNWTREDVTAKRASLEGELANRDGAKFAVIVTLVRESGAWKVYSFRLPGRAATAIADNPFSLMGRATAFNDASNRNLPTTNEVVTLVRETMQQFDTAVKQKNFANFYQYISVAWQSQLSEKRLQRAFQPFIDAGIDLRETQTLDPVFDREPQIDASGLLVINGSFPTQPYKLVFSLKYTYELPKWRLFGLNLNVVK